MVQAAPNAPAAPPQLDRSQVLHFDTLPMHKNPNGSESRNAISGQLPTGERVSVHESVQPAGIPANPAHRIDHTEFICVREGTVEFQHEDVTERASAGDIILVAKGTLHALRNIGNGPASYFVVAIGGDVK